MKFTHSDVHPRCVCTEIVLKFQVKMQSLIVNLKNLLNTKKNQSTDCNKNQNTQSFIAHAKFGITVIRNKTQK